MKTEFRLHLLTLAATLFAALCCAASAYAELDPNCSIEFGEPITQFYPTIRGAVSGCDTDNATPIFSIRENGSPVHDLKIFPGRPGQVESDPRNELVIMLDASDSMRGEKFTTAIAAAKKLLEQAGPHDRIGLMTFNGTVEVVVKPTKDLDAVRAGLDTLQLSFGTRMYDALVKLPKVFDDDATRQIAVLLSDGDDQGSKADVANVLSALEKSMIELYPVGIAGAGFTPVTLNEIAKSTNGGELQTVANIAQLSTTFESLGRSLLRGFWYEYHSSQPSNTDVLIKLTAKGEATRVHDFTTPKTSVEKIVFPEPKEATQSKPIISIPDSRLGQLLVTLPFGALVLFVAWLLIEHRTRPKIEKRIEVFTKRQTAVAVVDKTSKRESLLGPLYGITESMLGASNMFKRFKFLIDQANLPLREVELLYLMFAGGFIGILIGLIFLGGIVGLAIMTPVGAVLPYLWLKRKAKKRKKNFEEQLADVLSTIAASLKAGHSFNQSINAVIKEAPNPTAEELNRVMTEARLGMPIEDALQSMAIRMGSADFDFAVTTVNIQRTVGGSLSEILDMVGDTVRNRQQFRKKVKALTSMGSMSAYVLLGMPIFMMGAMTLLNHDFMAPLFYTSMGHKMLIAGAFFMFLGWAACKKIVTIKT